MSSNNAQDSSSKGKIPNLKPTSSTQGGVKNSDSFAPNMTNMMARNTSS
jgi:hypothetical protein